MMKCVNKKLASEINNLTHQLSSQKILLSFTQPCGQFKQVPFKQVPKHDAGRNEQICSKEVDILDLRERSKGNSIGEAIRSVHTSGEVSARTVR